MAAKIGFNLGCRSRLWRKKTGCKRNWLQNGLKMEDRKMHRISSAKCSMTISPALSMPLKILSDPVCENYSGLFVC